MAMEPRHRWIVELMQIVLQTGQTAATRIEGLKIGNPGPPTDKPEFRPYDQRFTKR
jgi:hypothetical protein